MNGFWRHVDQITLAMTFPPANSLSLSLSPTPFRHPGIVLAISLRIHEVSCPAAAGDVTRSFETNLWAAGQGHVFPPPPPDRDAKNGVKNDRVLPAQSINNPAGSAAPLGSRNAGAKECHYVSISIRNCPE